MATRVVKELKLKDEEYLFFGGNLTVTDEVTIVNSYVSISGEFTISSGCKVFIQDSNISASNIIFRVDVEMSGNIKTSKDLNACKIDTNGNIIVNGESRADDVSCRNYLVTGKNTSLCIYTSEDTYILGYNDCLGIDAREVLLAEGADMNDSYIKAKILETGGKIINCPSQFVEEFLEA